VPARMFSELASAPCRDARTRVCDLQPPFRRFTPDEDGEITPVLKNCKEDARILFNIAPQQFSTTADLTTKQGTACCLSLQT
jgi:hypothetical protein